MTPFLSKRMKDYSMLLVLLCTAELISSSHNSPRTSFPFSPYPYLFSLTPFSLFPSGLTVFRDQWFSSDVTGEAVKRIEGDENVLLLKLVCKSINIYRCITSACIDSNSIFSSSILFCLLHCHF